MTRNWTLWSRKVVDTVDVLRTRSRPAVARTSSSDRAIEAKDHPAPPVQHQTGRIVHTFEEPTILPQMEGATGGRPPIAKLSYLLFVFLPFLCALFYFNVMASSQYISEARFAVRTLSAPSESDLDLTASGSSGGAHAMLTMTSMTQDAYIVASFIHSNELLRQINQSVDLRSFFASADVDYFSRLPPDASQEKLLNYWKRHVSIYIDGPSGIITLKVRAFSPEAARKLADLIIKASEGMVNKLSVRAQHDVIDQANKEVVKAEAEYRSALSELNSYQNSSGIFDPTARATEAGTLLTQLMQQKFSIDTRLYVLRKSSVKNSPAMQQLQRTEASLADQIDELRGKLAATSTENDNLSSSLKKFSELETQLTIAQTLYQTASDNLSKARTEALQKSVYVTVFDEPAVPETSLYPRTFATPFELLIVLSVAWAVCMLIWASVEDHRL